MGQFGVKYSDRLPTAQSGLAKASINVDQGHEEFFRAITNLGTALRTLGANIQEEKDLADFSALKRQDNEDFAATQAAAKEIGFNDPEDDNGDI